MRSLLIGAALLAILCVPAAAQEQPPEPKETPKPQESSPPAETPKAEKTPKAEEAPKPGKPATVVHPSGGDLTRDGKVDPKKLMREIARDMAKVEAMLLEAGDNGAAGDSARAAVEKLDKLLGDAQKKQGQVIQQLDRLINEVRKQQQQKQSKSRGQRTKPQRPDRNEPQKDPRFDNRNKQPKDQPQRKRDRGKKEKADRNPKKGDQEQVKHPDKAGIWGLLPDKIFKLITNREQTVLPAEFREYIEEYFKRLAETKKQP